MDEKEQARFDGLRAQLQQEHDLALAEQETANKFRQENLALRTANETLETERRQLLARVKELAEEVGRLKAAAPRPTS